MHFLTLPLPGLQTSTPSFPKVLPVTPGPGGQGLGPLGFLSSPYRLSTVQAHTQDQMQLYPPFPICFFTLSEKLIFLKV